MTSFRFRVILLIILLIPFVAIIRMIRKKQLQIKFGLVWMIPILAVMLIALFPQSFRILADFLGIYDVANMLLFLGIVCSLIINFALTIAVSRLSGRIRKLTQVLAIDEQKIETFLPATDVKKRLGGNHF